MTLTIYWKTKDQPTRWKICRKLGIYYSATVNGETTANISQEKISLLQEVKNLGLIEIRIKPLKNELK